jgi:hypothetical protein
MGDLLEEMKQLFQTAFMAQFPSTPTDKLPDEEKAIIFLKNIKKDMNKFWEYIKKEHSDYYHNCYGDWIDIAIKIMSDQKQKFKESEE